MNYQVSSKFETEIKSQKTTLYKRVLDIMFFKSFLSFVGLKC